MAEGIHALPKRSEIEEQYTWRLEDIYPTNEDWEKDMQRVPEALQQFTQYKGRLLDTPRNLLEALRAYERLNQLLEKLVVYARMRLDEDQTQSLYQGMSDRAQAQAVQAGSATAFFVPELLQLTEEEWERFKREEGELGTYQFFIKEILRQKPHRRSAEEEEIIAMAGELAQAPGNIFSMLNNADIRFPTIRDEAGNEVELTKGRYTAFLESPDRRVRREAYEAMYQTYEKYRNTLAASLNASVKKEVFYARVRRYPSALEASLDKDSIPVSVYTSLIETIHEHLPLLDRYMRLRKRMLGLEQLHMYDLYVPMVAEVEMKVPYHRAQEMVKEGLHPLGEEYQKVLEQAFAERWIDVYENQGKRSGAYSWGAYGTHPYVLLNYQDNINNVFTLAHELGHAMHSYYSDLTQPYIYAQYTIFVAEVASTLNEALLMDHLLKQTTDRAQKMFLLNHYLEQFRTVVYRQVMFAEFEKIIHEQVERGEGLTADTLCDIYLDLNRKYYGREVEVDPLIAMEWSRVPHFYSNFYVYKYATGFSAAQALAHKILTEGQPAVERYLDFLKSGGSDTPIALLQKAGVDMSSPEPVREALQVFSRLLDEMEELST